MIALFLEEWEVYHATYTFMTLHGSCATSVLGLSHRILQIVVFYLYSDIIPFKYQYKITFSLVEILSLLKEKLLLKLPQQYKCELHILFSSFFVLTDSMDS